VAVDEKRKKVFYYRKSKQEKTEREEGKSRLLKRISIEFILTTEYVTGLKFQKTRKNSAPRTPARVDETCLPNTTEMRSEKASDFGDLSAISGQWCAFGPRCLFL
jgi:hypothetical protein